MKCENGSRFKAHGRTSWQKRAYKIEEPELDSME
jgi:hypothetical protein